MTRKLASAEKVTKWIADSLPVLDGIVADSTAILSELQVKEMAEPGLQFEQHAQKARAIRRIAEEIQERLRKLHTGLRLESQLNGAEK